MFTGKMYYQKSRKSLCQQLEFEVSSFGFYFVSALQYLDCYYKKNPLKWTGLLYIKLPLKPAFFAVFFLFWERYIFSYFKLIYFSISRPNSSMDGNERGIFSQAPGWKPAFA